MKIALHICCAVCAAGAAERLIGEGYQVKGFFCNPNIYPEQEYLKRLSAAQTVAEKLDFPLLEASYEPEQWEKAIADLESEPEGGRRCPICFKFRLKQTYQFMLDSGCEAFTTTLTMGSNKSPEVLRRIGQEIGGARFLDRDFKKKEGFKRAGELAKEWGLYRQHYCGCAYSLRDAEARQKRLT